MDGILVGGSTARFGCIMTNTVILAQAQDQITVMSSLVTSTGSLLLATHTICALTASPRGATHKVEARLHRWTIPATWRARWRRFGPLGLADMIIRPAT